MSGQRATFTPHFRASRPKRRASLFLIGPLLWIAAFAALGVTLVPREALGAKEPKSSA